MNTNKRLMVLGAGLFQVPLIIKAQQMGCTVITVDYLPDNIGHRHSDLSVSCSTVDKAGVLAHARRLSIDGIVTFASDVAVETVAYVGESLGLNTVSTAIAREMTNKIAFRHFQKRHGLAHPDFLVTGQHSVFSLPAGKRHIVKPVDSSGSKGIAEIQDEATARAAIDKAKSFSRSASVILEEYIDGIDVTGEGFVIDNCIAVCFFTRKISNGFIPVVHLLPSGIGAEFEAELLGVAERTFQAMGYREGPFDLDARISPHGAYVIEASPRLGGNGVPLAVSEATGNDYLGMLVDYSLGRLSSEFLHHTVHQPTLSRILFSAQKSRIARLPDPAIMLPQLPALKGLYFRYREGDITPGLHDSSTSVGYAILTTENIDHWEQAAQQLEAALDIRYEPVI